MKFSAFTFIHEIGREVLAEFRLNATQIGASKIDRREVRQAVVAWTIIHSHHDLFLEIFLLAFRAMPRHPIRGL